MSHFGEAKKFIAGGVNSPVRAFAGVGGEPVFISSARGAWLETVDGRKLIDYVGSWGPMILGHADPAVVTAVKNAAERGLSFGAPTLAETRLAEKVSRIPRKRLPYILDLERRPSMEFCHSARFPIPRGAWFLFRGSEKEGTK